MTRLLIILILIIIFFNIPMSCSSAAHIEGNLYEYGSYKQVENIILYINSTPVQSTVAKNGTYLFDVPPGIYKINASYYNDNNELAYYAEEDINIINNGNFSLDIIVFPSVSSTLGNNSIKSSNFNESNIANFYDFFSLSYIYFILLSLLTAIVFYIIFKKMHSKSKNKINQNKNNIISQRNIISKEEFEIEKNEENQIIEELEIDDNIEIIEIPKGPISTELEEIIDIIRSQGGRITQKDLRKRIKYSEAKVSLMLFELEKREIIQKFKKGRGNVILLVDEKSENNDT